MRIYQSSEIQTLDHLPETGDDLVDDKQIRATIVGPGIVEHQSPFSNSDLDIWDAVQVEQWSHLRRLGRGGFGDVHLEQKIFERFPQSRGSRPQLRAVKVVPKREGGSSTIHHLPEILGMAKFSKYGASFVELFTWFQIGSDICIAMEWAPYGDLEECVLKPLPEVEAQEIIRQVSLAVVIMHERQFLHRDLKPKNVFVFRKQPESPEWRVKLGDFGVSKRVRPAANTSWHTSIEADCSAPEVLGLLGSDYTEESSYANPVDMWSLGYLAHWLLTKRYPLSKFALPKHCRQMDPVPLSELANCAASNLAADFVKNLLHLAPAARMTAQEAYRHPWLALPHKGSKLSPEPSNIPYPSQKSRETTSTRGHLILDDSRKPQFAKSQGSSRMPRVPKHLVSSTLVPTKQTHGDQSPLEKPKGGDLGKLDSKVAVTTPIDESKKFNAEPKANVPTKVPPKEANPVNMSLLRRISSKMFKHSTSTPKDLVPILTKDPPKDPPKRAPVRAYQPQVFQNPRTALADSNRRTKRYYVFEIQNQMNRYSVSF